MNADDETNITDIELMPDGRIYVFGASEEVLVVLDELQGGGDPAIRERLLRNEIGPAEHNADCQTR